MGHTKQTDWDKKQNGISSANNVQPKSEKKNTIVNNVEYDSDEGKEIQNKFGINLGMPPRCIESENLVLGNVILDRKLWEDLKVQISAEAFYDNKNRKLVEAFHEMDSQNIPIDTITILDWFRKTGDSDKAGGWLHWTYLTEIAISGIDIQYHLTQINKAYTGRKLWERSHRLLQALENGNSQSVEQLKQEISSLSYEDTSKTIIILADQQVGARRWLIEGLFPEGFPSIIFGAGGLGKSFLALHLGILACMGGQLFMGHRFPEEALNVLLLDWELDVDEQALRGKQISRGINLLDVPKNLHYFAPVENISRVIPKLKSFIKTKDIRFIIIDSIGASGADGESVQEVVKLLNGLKELGIATLVLDHQSKMQAGEKYGNKTPFGSVYKENLARSVFQLSRIEAHENYMTLRLRHAKTNFSKFADDIIFDMCFEGDSVLFTESNTATYEDKQQLKVWQAIKDIEDVGKKSIQKAIIEELKGEISRDKVITLLKKGDGKYWDSRSGERTEVIYKTRNLENGIYNSQGSSFLNTNVEDTSND